VGAGAEHAGEVEGHEDEHDCDDDEGKHEASVAAIGLRLIVVVSGVAWHRRSSRFQLMSVRAKAIDPDLVATAP
jgi:hypothetical protein